MIDGRNLFNEPIKNDIKTWKYLKNDYSSRRWLGNWLLTWLNIYKTTVIVYQQQAFDADPKATQKFDFTADLDWVVETFMFFIYE